MFRKNNKNKKFSNVLIFTYFGIALFIFSACGPNSESDGGTLAKDLNNIRAIKL